jgi:hypothetical protein
MIILQQSSTISNPETTAMYPTMILAEILIELFTALFIALKKHYESAQIRKTRAKLRKRAALDAKKSPEDSKIYRDWIRDHENEQTYGFAILHRIKALETISAKDVSKLESSDPPPYMRNTIDKMIDNLKVDYRAHLSALQYTMSDAPTRGLDGEYHEFEFLRTTYNDNGQTLLWEEHAGTCANRGGCCGRACGCCAQPLQERYIPLANGRRRKVGVYGHCTKECLCCNRFYRCYSRDSRYRCYSRDSRLPEIDDNLGRTISILLEEHDESVQTQETHAELKEKAASDDEATADDSEIRYQEWLGKYKKEQTLGFAFVQRFRALDALSRHASTSSSDDNGDTKASHPLSYMRTAIDKMLHIEETFYAQHLLTLQSIWEQRPRGRHPADYDEFEFLKTTFDDNGQTLASEDACAWRGGCCARGCGCCSLLTERQLYIAGHCTAECLRCNQFHGCYTPDSPLPEMDAALLKAVAECYQSCVPNNGQ